MNGWSLRNGNSDWFDGKGWTDDPAQAVVFGNPRAANDMAAIWATPSMRPDIVPAPPEATEETT